MKIIKTIIVDDHHIFRQGLITLLNKIPYVKVVAEASNGQDYLNLIENLQPDLVLLDIKMPKINGIEAAKLSLLKYPDIKIIVLTMFDDERYYKEMLSIGCSGFLSKNIEFDELEKAIKVVSEGSTYFPSSLYYKINDNEFSKSENSEDTNEIKEESPKVKFSKRELEILSLICKGLTTAEIAQKLFVSQRTVEGHRANLMSKTGSKNAISLVIYAIKNKLVNI